MRETHVSSAQESRSTGVVGLFALGMVCLTVVVVVWLLVSR